MSDALLACAACDRGNPPGNRFCGGCGAELGRSCPSCGRENPADHAFCGGCGERLAEAQPGRSAAGTPQLDEPRAYTPEHLAKRILTSRSALEGERKNVTVLFVDTVASSAIGEANDPEVVHGVMDRCFRLILEHVHRYEGSVNQFLGDGAMALFGAPVAVEAAPRCAVLAALGIQRGLESLSEEIRSEHGIEFRMRIGINSGPVVVGRIGDDLRMDYTAVGDTTNLADRMQKLAAPGSIVISAATERLVRGFFELRALGVQKIAGRSGEVRAFEVLSELAVGDRIDAYESRDLTLFVGRELELDALRRAYEFARQGRGQVAFVVGDPGIGKSRLVHQLREQLGSDTEWLRGRCTAYTQTTPFAPIIDALRRHFGIEERDSDVLALEKLAQATAALAPDLAWTLPFMQQLLSLPVEDPALAGLDAPERRAETSRAILTRLQRLAEQSPLVFVIEDLHWIDRASEELLGYLADSIPTAHVLLLLTHRPGYTQPFGDRSYYVRVGLQALGGDEMASMVGSVLGSSSLPVELRQLIARKAEGNPFFVEEVTRSLVEEGVLRVDGGGVEITRAVSDISVPDTIQDVLMARIDRLADAPKRAIQIASVIGREFAMRLLEKLSESGDRLSEVVAELRALELVYEKASHPELALMFKHALTRDVAYESVLVERRKALHRVVGLAIEELYRDRLAEHFETLASHFAMAEDWERALDYYERAAAKAASAYANQAAAEHCRQALAIAERLGEGVAAERVLRLAELLGDVCMAVNEFAASGRAYELAAARAGPGELRSRNLSRAAYSHLWAHDYSASRRLVRQARELAEALGSDAACAIALVSEYEQAMVEGETGLGHLAVEAVSIAERSGDPEALVRSYTHLAQYEEWMGRFREAISLSERALEITKRESMGALAVYPSWYLGLALCGSGDYGRGVQVFGDTLMLCARLGDRALRARFLNSMGWCHAEFGAHERASEYNAESTDLAGELVELGLVASAPELYANAAINLAGNRIALGDSDGALEYLDPVRASLEQSDDPWMRWRYSLHTLDALARYELSRGEPERALPLTSQEIEGARRHKAGKLEARALELRGRTLLALDRREEAGQELHAAHAVALGIGYPPVLWRSTSLLAELARRAGDEGEAARLFAEARGLVERFSRTLPQNELRSGLLELAERLEDDPLGAYR